jgi:hexulose-6-phosphate isomerase
MQKGINRWAFPGSWSLDEVIAAAVKHGFAGLELNLEETGDLGLDTTPDEAATVAERVRAAGLEIPAFATGLYWTRSLSSPDEEERQAGLTVARHQMRLAAAMDVDHLLVVPGAVDVFFLPEKPPVPYVTAWALALRSLLTLADEAEAHKVILCLENVWNRFLLSPMEFVRFLDEVDSLVVRAYFDVGNCFAFGYPDDWIHVLDSHVSRVHVKDFRRSVGTADGFCNVGEGDIDFTTVRAALDEIGYDGWVTAEVFPGSQDDPDTFLSTTSRAMDSFVG